MTTLFSVVFYGRTCLHLQWLYVHCKESFDAFVINPYFQKCALVTIQSYQILSSFRQVLVNVKIIFVHLLCWCNVDILTHVVALEFHDDGLGLLTSAVPVRDDIRWLLSMSKGLKWMFIFFATTSRTSSSVSSFFDSGIYTLEALTISSGILLLFLTFLFRGLYLESQMLIFPSKDDIRCLCWSRSFYIVLESLWWTANPCKQNKERLHMECHNDETSRTFSRENWTKLIKNMKERCLKDYNLTINPLPNTLYPCRLESPPPPSQVPSTALYGIHILSHI